MILNYLPSGGFLVIIASCNLPRWGPRPGRDRGALHLRPLAR